jgi:hypothetical protein
MERREFPDKFGTEKVPVTEVKESPAGALRAAPPLFRSKAACAVVARAAILPRKDESFMLTSIAATIEKNRSQENSDGCFNILRHCGPTENEMPSERHWKSQ